MFHVLTQIEIFVVFYSLDFGSISCGTLSWGLFHWAPKRSQYRRLEFQPPCTSQRDFVFLARSLCNLKCPSPVSHMSPIADKASLDKPKFVSKKLERVMHRINYRLCCVLRRKYLITVFICFAIEFFWFCTCVNYKIFRSMILYSCDFNLTCTTFCIVFLQFSFLMKILGEARVVGFKWDMIQP